MSPLFRTRRRSNRSTNRFSTPHRLNFNKSHRARLMLQPLEERAVPATFTVTDPADTLTPGTLRQALTDLQGSGDVTNTIDFSTTGGFFTSPTTITAATPLPDITKNVVIDGTGVGGADTVLVSGGTTSRIFVIPAATAITAEFKGITITAGANTAGAGTGGGAAVALLSVSASITLSSSTISNNKSTVAVNTGSAISAPTAYTGTITINNSLVTGNSGSARGAIYFFDSGKLSVSNSSFTFNTSTTGGGAIGVFSGNSTITGSTFTNNRNATSGGGGAIFTSSGSLSIASSTFNTNTSAVTGGAIMSGASTSIDSSSFTGNTSGSTGGALRIAGATTITNSTLTGNTAATIGGGFYSSVNNLTMSNSTFTTNTAGGVGGGLRNSGTTTLTNVLFTGNTAGGNGGGFYSSGGTTLNVISNARFVNNTAAGTSGGGGLMMTSGGGTISSTTFVNNRSTNASGSGGGARVNSSMTFNFCDFTTNTAASVSGGLHNAAGLLTVNNSTFYRNTAAFNGGAINSSASTTINNSTFNQNTASGTAGGTITQSAGGALSIRSSTIHDNTSTNSAVALGGAGILRTTTSTSTTITLNSTIVTDNKMPNSASTNNKDFFSSVTQTTSILGSQAMIVSTANLGTNASFLNAPVIGTGGLNPLADNNGVVIADGTKIRTMELTNVSAIDAGNNTIAFTGNDKDQRGLVSTPRVQGPAADIGAFEVANFAPSAGITVSNVTVISGTGQVTVTYTDINGSGSIDVGTIDVNDIKVTGPAGYVAEGAPDVATISINPGVDGSPITVVYSFVAADNTVANMWDFSDNGSYTVAVKGGQVFDKDGTPLSVSPTSTTFTVSVGKQLVVDTAGDASVSTGPNSGDLRFVIGVANADVGVVDTITFSGVSSISMALGAYTITNSMVIDGPGTGPGGLTIDAGLASRHFTITAPNTTISDMKLINGNVTGLAAAGAGGSIFFTTQTVTLNQMTLSGNTGASRGGAIYLSTGTLNATRTIISSNVQTGVASGDGGGGLYIRSTGTANVRESTLNGNTAAAPGGGLYSFSGGNFIIDRSTISRNVTNSTAAGGGGGYFFGGTSLITNSTVANNTAAAIAGGGLAVFGSAVIRVHNSTIASNSAGTSGGGIQMSSGTVHLVSTIVSDNAAPTSGPDIVGTIASNSKSLISNVAGATFTGGTGTSTVGVSADLVALAGNGGPTETMIPNKGSPVLDVGTPTVTTIANTMGIGDTTVTVAAATSLRIGMNILVDAENMLITGITGVTLTVTRAQDSTTAVGHTSGANVDWAWEQRGQGFARAASPTNIGAVEGFFASPTPTVSTLVAPGDVPSASNATYTIQVVYVDDSSITVGTIDAGDLTVFGRGYDPVLGQDASSFNVDNITTQSVTVTYTFPAPAIGTPTGFGGNDGWNIGTYTIKMNSGEVGDNSTNFVAAKDLATFKTTFASALLVDEATDTDDNDLNVAAGTRSFREALRATNTNVFGVDTINFKGASFPSGTTITLLGATLLVTDEAVINGPGAGNLILDGGGAKEIMGLNALTGSGKLITINDIAFQNGSSLYGGGLFVNEDKITLNRVIISGNVAGEMGGGIVVLGDATLTINDSLIQNNVSNSTQTFAGGGAIALLDQGASDPVVNLVRTTVTGNSAVRRGGAVYFYLGGTINADSCTFDNNIAGNTGGAIGGWNFSANITSSTLSSNTANGTGNGGAIGWANIGSLTMKNSTVFGNSAAGAGGGLNLGGASTITSTIVAGNAATGAGKDINGSVTITGDNNLIGVADSGGFVLANPGGNPQVGSTANPLNPGLDPVLQLNGSQVSNTKTHAVLAGSPAINNGNNNDGLPFDQRGGDGPGGLADFKRVVAGTADIGAFEFDPGAIPQVKVLVAPGDVAAASNATYTIQVVYSDDVDMLASTIDLADVTVFGPGYAVAGQNATAVLINNDAGANVTVTYTFPAPTAGTPAGFGGNDGWNIGAYTIKMNGSEVFDDDNADLTGDNAVVATQLATFKTTIASSIIVDLRSDIDDGNYLPGFRTLREALTVTNGNLAFDTIGFTVDPLQWDGTPILQASSLAIGDSVSIAAPGSTKLVLDGNSTDRVLNINPAGSGTVIFKGFTAQNGNVAGSGGGILIGNDSVTLDDVVVDKNTAANDGGGISVANGATLMLTNAKLSGNTATTGSGGGLYLGEAATVTVDDTVVSGNVSGFGAGLYMGSIGSSVLNVIDSDITGNSASQPNAAGIGAYAGTINVTDSLISGNSGGHTGGILMGGTNILVPTAKVVLTNSTVSLNSGTSTGGVRVQNQYVTEVIITNSTISGNSGGASTGGIYIGGGTLDVIGSIVSGNSGGGTAGAIRALYGAVSIANSTISGNTALGAGSAGGAWVIYGELSIVETTMSGNVGAAAGAIYAYYTAAPVSIVRSTISGNSSTAGGGAIATYYADIEMENSTVSGNNGIVGGIYLMAGTVNPTITIRNSTIANNTGVGGAGGLQISNTTVGTVVNLSSTIVAGNTGTSANNADIGTTGAFTITANSSLIGANDTAAYTLSGTGNVTGTVGSPQDPGLDPLGNYGGPTETHRLKATSVAVNAGLANGLLVDQRGQPRVSGGTADIGAYERQPLATVSSIVFGDGTVQRSMVQQLIVNFSAPVTFSGNVTAAITLSRSALSDNFPDVYGSGNVTLTPSQASGTMQSVTFTFSGAFVEFTSLVQGLYDLNIDADQISTFDGLLDGEFNGAQNTPSGNGTAGGDYVAVGTTANGFYRLFGDSNGDGISNLIDFDAFRLVVLNSASTIFDYDGAGGIPDLLDFDKFRRYFGDVA